MRYINIGTGSVILLCKAEVYLLESDGLLTYSMTGHLCVTNFKDLK
jgi:hypothetical protein